MDDIKCKFIFKEEIKDFEIMVKEMIGGFWFMLCFEINIMWKIDGN